MVISTTHLLESNYKVLSQSTNKRTLPKMLKENKFSFVATSAPRSPNPQSVIFLGFTPKQFPSRRRWKKLFKFVLYFCHFCQCHCRCRWCWSWGCQIRMKTIKYVKVCSKLLSNSINSYMTPLFYFSIACYGVWEKQSAGIHPSSIGRPVVFQRWPLQPIASGTKGNF